MKRWHRLLDGWLIGALLLLTALIFLIGCIPTPPPIQPAVPVVLPAKVVVEPVCTRRDGSGVMGWGLTLQASGQYRIKIFNGPYPPIIDYSWPRLAPFYPGTDPNRAYVQTRTLPWVLEFLHGNGRWYEISARITTKPPVLCSV